MAAHGRMCLLVLVVLVPLELRMDRTYLHLIVGISPFRLCVGRQIW